MSEWQPIETAPKDGTRILVYGKTWPEIAVAEWRPTCILPEAWVLHPYCESDAEPSHWMPLPSSPEDVK